MAPETPAKYLFTAVRAQQKKQPVALDQWCAHTHAHAHTAAVSQLEVKTHLCTLWRRLRSHQTGRRQKKTSVVSELWRIRWLVSLSVCVSVRVCVCIGEAAADRRALGDYGTGRGTITHRRPQTDSQAGLNADGSLIGICHQEPTKSIYLKGGVRRGNGWEGDSLILTLTQTGTHAHGAHYQATARTFFFYSPDDSSYSHHVCRDRLFFLSPSTNIFPKRQNHLSAFLFNTAAQILQTDHHV